MVLGPAGVRLSTCGPACTAARAHVPFNNAPSRFTLMHVGTVRR